jgi:hypothetical protein
LVAAIEGDHAEHVRAVHDRFDAPPARPRARPEGAVIFDHKFGQVEIEALVGDLCKPSSYWCRGPESHY